MPYYPGRDDRRTLRLRDYDYAQPGAYFVTICVEGRRCLFGHIAEGASVLNDPGRMVADLLDCLPGRFPNVTVDASVVMPNHVHAILILHECPVVGVGPRAYPCPPIDRTLQRTSCASSDTGTHMGVPLPDVVGWFKTMTTNAYIRGVRDHGWARFDGRLWQRNYFERVLRDEDRLARARRYVAENPARWADDPER
jgi:REP element-mobilizing transposase RayT